MHRLSEFTADNPAGRCDEQAAGDLPERIHNRESTHARLREDQGIERKGRKGRESTQEPDEDKRAQLRESADGCWTSRAASSPIAKQPVIFTKNVANGTTSCGNMRAVARPMA
jgi:hypothetical protein